MSTRAPHAVIIGGSVAGLMTAAAISAHFDHVTIVERDELPEGRERVRRGVPQGFHVHGLSPGGQKALDEIYEGSFTETARAFGVPYYDTLRHHALLIPEGWLRRAPSDIRTLFASRWTIEHVIRTLTRALRNVEFVVGQATGLVASPDRRRVTGLRYRSDQQGEVTIDADLVVDASGRGSKAPKWVEELGYQAPTESLVHPYLGYATCYCHVPADAWPGDLRSIGAPPFLASTRGGFVVPQEDDLVGFMAAGTARDYPPGDHEGFTEFLRTANTPAMHEIWRQAEPVTEIRTTRTSVNRLRRWHELERRPGGFVAVGDAVAAFNPVYGQGITTAALQASALADRMRESEELDDVVTKWPATAFAVSGFAWNMATESDLARTTTTSENLVPTVVDEEGDRYMNVVRQLATEDPFVAQEFLRAMGLMDPRPLFTEEVRQRVERRRSAAPVTASSPLSPPPAWSDGAEAVPALD